MLMTQDKQPEAQEAPASEPSDLIRRLEQFVSFLCGAATYDDAWFGDRHSTGMDEPPGPFWWRTPLRSLEKELVAALGKQEAPASERSEFGWLIEHGGGVFGGQISWLKANAPNLNGDALLGYTVNASEALRFARKEDAEAVLKFHLGIQAPDWYTEPYSVTEHMWPAALGKQPTQELPPPDVPNTHAQPGGAFFQGSYSRALVERIVAAQKAPASERSALAEDQRKELIQAVNEMPLAQSLLYDLNLLPEQIEPGTKEWSYLVSVMAHLGRFRKYADARIAFGKQLTQEAPADAKDAARYRDALVWALGAGDDFRPQGTMDGKFWWRGELAERAGLTWDGERYIDSALQSHQEGK